MRLAGESGVYSGVQRVAQSVLRSGWNILLCTVSERASALSELLPSGEGEGEDTFMYCVQVCGTCL